MKRALLTTVLAAIPLVASAMDPIPDASLAETTGQAGLTITISPMEFHADHLRYSDSDGIPGGIYDQRGSVDFADFTVTQSTPTTITIDAGSTGLTSSGKSGLLLAISDISNMSITTGNITVDSGGEITPNTASPAFGDLQLTNIDVSGLKFLITNGGKFTNSGATLTTLMPINMSMSFNFDDLANGGVINGNFGIRNYEPGYLTVEAGNVGQGLIIGYGDTTIDGMWISNLRLGPNLASAEMGGFYLSNVVMGSSYVGISGH